MQQSYTPASTFRQLMAMFYDSFIVIALWMLLTFVIVRINHFQAISSHNIYYQVCLLLAWAVFYIYFIKRDGRTIGMLSWRLRIYSRSTNVLKYWQILLRFIVSIVFNAAGLVNFWWKFIDADRLTLADRLTNTCVVILPAGKAKSQTLQTR